MSEQQAYPYWRVIIGFTLCPAMVNVAMLVGLFEHIFLQPSSHHPWWIYLVMMVPVTGVALVFYGVPALILALIYASLKLYKSFGSYVFVSLYGGIGAHLWGVAVNYLKSHKEYVFPYLIFPGLGPYGPFFLAAALSLIMAYIVLPPRKV